MTRILNLDTQAHRSRVLDTWLSTRPGAAERLGQEPVALIGENSHMDGMSLSELVSLLGASYRTAAGENVTAETAARVSAVYSCVSLIAGAIASLPLGFYERTNGDRGKADHPYWWYFNESASDGWTSFDAIQYLFESKFFEGDGFGEILRARNSNRMVGWRPLDPRRVEPFKKDGRVLYRVQPSDGPGYVVQPEDMIHLTSLGFDGLRSPSLITYAAREAIGTAIAGQKYTGRFFAGGASFDYALKTSAKLKQSQLDMLKASLLARLQNGGRGPLILDGGLEPAQLSVNSKDAEILATRLFTVEDICRFFGVPPHMVGHTEKQTSFGSGVEQQGIGFVRYTLERHLTPMAQELNRKLWPVRERYFVEHIRAALERADLKSRYEAYRIAMGRAGEMPWMDAAEVRRLENMPPNTSLTMNPAKSPKKDDDDDASETAATA